MFIPNSITLPEYHGSQGRSNRLLKREDFKEWCSNSALSLKRLCLNTILDHWQESPFINEFCLDEDVRFVLDNLPTDLPYKLAVTHINDELYWRRAFKARWPGKMLPEKPQKLDYEIPNQYNRHSSRNHQICVKLNTWKCFYIERHLQDLLEHLKPQQYDPEEMKELIELSKDYVIRLKLNQLQAPIEHDSERIPLNAILPALPNLKQLTICFKQTYVGDNFSWHVLQTTQKDIDNLAMGLNSCNLNILRIINTDITCNKLTTIAWNLLNNEQLRILDFSHCKIADKGIIAICKLIQELSSLQEVNLMNNFIGAQGVEVLSFALCSVTANLKRLDLSLNNFGATGSDYLATMLAKNKQLRFLNLSACGLSKCNVETLIRSLELNATLLELDLSNNNLEEATGKLLQELFKSKNRSLKKIDLRMTAIPAEIVLDIEDLLHHSARLAEEINKGNNCKKRLNGTQKAIKGECKETLKISNNSEVGKTDANSYAEEERNNTSSEIESNVKDTQMEKEGSNGVFPQFKFNNIDDLERKLQLENVFKEFFKKTEIEEHNPQHDNAERQKIEQEYENVSEDTICNNLLDTQVNQ